MTDIRFTTEFAGLDDLVVGFDIDGIDDLETLLMFLREALKRLELRSGWTRWSWSKEGRLHERH